MAALSTLRGYVRDELGELTAGRWSDAQINSWLNRGVDYCIAEFHRGKCYEMLREIIKYTTYTLNTSYQEYTFWDVINNSLASTSESSTNTWFGYIQAMQGDYIYHIADAEEWHKLNATTGEHAPTSYEPWIYFSGHDRTTKYLSYSTILKTNEPDTDELVTGGTGAATARIAIKVPPDDGTWAVGSFTGQFYIYDDSGTFEAENLDLTPLKGSAAVEDVVTITGAAVASVHDCPLFQVWPTPASADTFKLWWLNKADTMSAATDTPSLPNECDELLVLYATARGWKAEGRQDMHTAFWQEFMQELLKKVDNYRETVFKP